MHAAKMGVESAVMSGRLLLSVFALAPLVSTCDKPSKSSDAPPAQGATEIEVVAEPSHRLAFENQYVRAFKLEVPPNGATLKHRHPHDYVTVTFGAAELSNEVDGKAPATVKLENGQVRFTEGRGPAHLVKNLVGTPFRNVTIEFLQDDAAHKAAPPLGEDSGVSTAPGGNREIAFVKDGVRVSKISLQSGGTQPKSDHTGPELIVAVTDVDLGKDAKDKGPAAVQLKAGDIKWMPSGLANTLTNVGQQEAKIVLLEFM
jgi:quercetin dioxygenase-like cupin family protein